eukprot:1952096-Pleurochrysis_carterae.AAC.2
MPPLSVVPGWRKTSLGSHHLAPAVYCSCTCRVLCSTVNLRGPMTTIRLRTSYYTSYIYDLQVHAILRNVMAHGKASVSLWVEARAKVPADFLDGARLAEILHHLSNFVAWKTVQRTGRKGLAYLHIKP